MKNDPHCTLCRLNQTTDNVCILGRGPQRCDVMIVGEAPGREEERLGKPFVGSSGQLLLKSLREAGISEDDVYICNAVSCRPPENRTPTKAEIRSCKHWLDYQIEHVKPKYVLILGNTPLQSITGKAGITKRRGRAWEQDDIIYLATYHPAFVLRDMNQEATFANDIRLFASIIQYGGIPEEPELEYRSVLNWDDVDDMIEDLTGSVAYDIETNQLYPWRHAGPESQDPKIQSIGFCTSRMAWCLPVYHPQSPWEKDELEEIIERIDDRLRECSIITHNGKFDCLWMRVHFGVEWEIDFDTMLAHYLLDENDRHGLKYLAMKFLGAPDWEIDTQEKQGQAPWKRHAKYLAHDVFFTRKLRFLFGKLLQREPRVKQVFSKILIPCANLFVEVEFDGVHIDQTKFEDAEKYLRGEYDGALKRLKKWEPQPELDKRGRPVEFNWGSPQQLAHLLFDILEIDVVEETPTGNPSTSESVLKRIDHPCIADLLKFREAKQQLSFFIEGWKPFMVNGRLHPSFKLHGTVTGRLSAEHPNLQQVPRDPRIRTLISARPGWTLIEADLSQIELRIAAELAGESAMIHAFNNGIDVHWLTAIREIARGGALKDLVLDTARTANQDKTLGYADSIKVLLDIGPDAAAEINKIWKEYRKKAKAINFGYLYGMWWKKFRMYARDNYGVSVSDKEAQDSRIAFFDLYSDLPDWHNRQRRYARKYGHVESLSGRKRRLPTARHAQDTPERREAERQAINSPVQSFANEINLMAALQLRKEFPRKVLKIVGTVHDAILMEVRDDYVERAYTRTLEIMSGPELFKEFDIELNVPIEAEAKIGPWGAGVSLEKWKKQRVHA